MSATITYVPNGTPFFFQITGTGTPLDSHAVAGVFVLDPATGLPVSPAGASSTPTGVLTSVGVAAAGLNSGVVKAAAGQVTSVHAANIGPTMTFLKLYNKATTPVPATDTPIAIYGIPPYGVITLDLTSPVQCATGIALLLTTGAAHTDATGVTVGSVVWTLGFR